MMLRTALRTMLALVLAACLMGALAQSALALTGEDPLQEGQFRPGGRGAGVTELQRRLRALGYYGGGLSNVYSPRTESAVRALQRAAGLPETGVGDPATRAAAFSAKAPTLGAYQKASYTAELRPGRTGGQVEQYQGRLVKYGYLAAASGVYDGATALATRYFQAANGLPASGIATPKTRALINKESGPVAYAAYEAAQLTCAFKPGAFGLGVAMVQDRLKGLGYYKGAVNGKCTADTAKAVVLFKKFNNFKKAAAAVSAADRARIDAEGALSHGEVYGDDTIKPGASGQSVLAAQVVLREMKYYKGPINGRYGPQMVKAVKQMQAAHKLYPTGWLLSPSMEILERNSEKSAGVDARAYAALDLAQGLLGKKYRLGTAGPDTFDCSGFTYYVFKKAFGRTLAQSAAAQSQRGKLVAKRANILPGDLVFFATGKSTTRVNHVGLVYSVEKGNIRFVHASSARHKVVTSAFKDGENGDFYNERFRWARRMW